MKRKGRAIFAGTAAVFSVIPGCSSFEIFKYDSVPVVRAAVKAGATRASIEAAGGKANSEVNTPQNGGTCLNYVLLTDKGATTPFFVALTQSKRVANYGYVTCETALTEKYPMPSEAMKQVY